jgi:hypothetical protein
LEWARARDVSAWAKESLRVAADVVARFGPPSYQQAGQTPTVFAYAGPDDAAWLYFDFEDGALRDVRLPARFPDALVDLRPSTAAEVEAPEDVYRRFLIKSLSGDEAAIRSLILPSEDPSVLWEGAYPDDVARVLAAQYRSMQVVRNLEPAEAVSLVSEGFGEPLTLVRAGATWRVDPTPLVRGSERTSATSPWIP